jgi:2'-5' RNA ligase
MRLFFALWPGEEVRARLAAWSKRLRAACGGRPTRVENLHMTLAFLGSVEAERVSLVASAADGVAARCCTLVLDRPGVWRDIVWAGASAAPAELDALVLELREALARSRVDFDSKEFASHVTLLRDARKPGAMPELEPIRWELDGFALVSSRLQAGGSRYEILRSWAAQPLKTPR